MNRAGHKLAEYDPTGTVNLHDPVAVEAAIGAILDRRYGRYDRLLLQRCVDDLVRCYGGRYAGLLQCDTHYHDLRHVLETGLTMARLVDGDCEVGGHNGPPLDAEQALLGICLAFFHDVGLLRRPEESRLWGAQLLPIHEERSVEFMVPYLQATSLVEYASKAELIMPTKLNFSMPADWAVLDRKMASMIASADLMSQMADRCYLEKCRDFLYLEFGAIGLSGKADSPYPDPATLLRKTPGFVNQFVRDRLDREFGGIFSTIAAHFSGANPYQESVSRHMNYLAGLLDNHNLAALRRQPQAFIEAVTV